MKLSVNNKTTIANEFTMAASVIIMSLAPSFCASADENDAILNLTPTQCVAIHQGQKCYVDIEIAWSTAQQGEYCLFSSQQTHPIQCWSQAQNGKFEQEIIATKNVQFLLKRQTSKIVIMTKELEMVWVYKKSSRARSSWRMF